MMDARGDGREAIWELGASDAELSRLVQVAGELFECSRQGTALALARRELGRLRSELKRGERMRALGETAAGVVHDLRNVLNAIGLQANMLVSSRGDANAVKVGQAVARSVSRGDAMLARVAAAAGGEGDPRGPVSISKVAEEALSASYPRITSCMPPVDVSCQLSRVPDIDGDFTGLMQVAFNFVQNAVDAMPKGGVIKLSTIATEKEVHLAVEDTGVGMTPEVMRCLFRPFFSTKGRQGRGIGLASAHAIARSHGGRIDVRSAPGEGSTFLLRLPVPPAEEGRLAS